MTPTRIGRYEILRTLGKGAMGIVYLAQDPQIERTLALKTVRFDSPSQSFGVAEAKARFLKEAKISGRLQHPNIVTVYDVGEDAGVLYLAMEYVSGGSLSQRLADPGEFPIVERIRILSEVSDALAHAHQRGVIHRDVKPANILLTDASVAKVTDFGIGKLLSGDTDLTTAGQMVGSPAYMSPEQVRGERLDVRSDIFSLGVVLYQTLTLKKPFPADTLTTLIYQILHDEPQDPLEHNGDLPPEVTEIARRCLAKHREERYSDATELADDLRALIGITPVVSTAALSESKMRRARALAAAGAEPAAPQGPPPAETSPPRAAPAPSSVPPPPPVDLSASRRMSRTSGRTSTTSSQHGPAAIAGAAAGGFVLVGLIAGGFFLLRSQGFFRGAPAPPDPGPVPAASPMPEPTPPPPTPVPGSGALPAVSPTPSPGRTAPPRSPVAAARFSPTPTRPPRARPTPTETPTPVPTATPTPTPPPLARPDATYITRRDVRVNVTPDQARVYLDGRYLGVSDDWDGAGGGTLLAFAGEGRHRLRFAHAGYRDFVADVVVTGNAIEERVDIDRELEKGEPGGPTGPHGKVPRPDYRTAAFARLSVEPPFAIVTVDGHEMGPVSRFAQQDLQFQQTGAYDVILSAPGYAPRRVRVLVSPAADEERATIKERLRRR